jgi:hypothetical protein
MFDYFKRTEAQLVPAVVVLSLDADPSDLSGQLVEEVEYLYGWSLRYFLDKVHQELVEVVINSDAKCFLVKIVHACT